MTETTAVESSESTSQVDVAPTTAEKQATTSDSVTAPPRTDGIIATNGSTAAATEPTAESGLFGWGGITEGIGQLWGSVSGEADNSNNDVTPVTKVTEAAKPALSPSLAPLTKAATEIAASATTELGNAGKVAQIRLGEAAKEVERGWGVFNSFLDDILTPQQQQSGGGAGGGGDGVEQSANRGVSLEGAVEKLHERFPSIDKAEEAVEVYECAMMQKYRSVLNGATPEKTFACSGVLYVTPAHLAMYVMDDGGAFGSPFGTIIPLADVKRVQRGNKNMLRVLMVDQSSYVFAAFASVDTFKAAVDVLHHLVGTDDTKKAKSKVKKEEDKEVKEEVKGEKEVKEAKES